MVQSGKKIMILGPTASGKSELALHLAKELEGEIISVDSRQCYRRLDIGTAKPNPSELDQIPHHNISVLDLTEKDTVASFLRRSAEWEREIHDRCRQIVYAGGSTLHLQGLIQPFDELPGPKSENLDRLQERAEQEGLQVLHEELAAVDPVYASGIEGLNRHRIFRALDVWIQTGRPFSSFHQQKEIALPENMIVFGLKWPRALLHDRINSRVDLMIKKGLVEETRRILNDGYPPSLQSLQTVGYRDVIEHLEGGKSHSEMILDIKTQTRRYAKRQMTWFRRWPFIRWIDPLEMSAVKMAGTIKQDLAADMNKG